MDSVKSSRDVDNDTVRKGLVTMSTIYIHVFTTVQSIEAPLSRAVFVGYNVGSAEGWVSG